MGIALVTDSTSDLPPSLVERYSISVIPTILILGQDQYLDGKGITREEYYKRLPEYDPPPTTASAAPAAYSQIYENCLSHGADQVLSIHVASQLSSVYSTACLAAGNFHDRVKVMDSGQLSLGLGFQVLAAAEALEDGANLEEAIQTIRQIQKRIKVLAMLGTLEQLRRSGRVSSMRAGLGALLKVKLFLEVRSGEVLRIGEARTRNKGIAHFKLMLRRLGKLERLAMLHTNAEQEAQAILDEFSAGLEYPPLLANVTTIIGTHVGANALGFAAVLAE